MPSRFAIISFALIYILSVLPVYAEQEGAATSEDAQPPEPVALTELASPQVVAILEQIELAGDAIESVQGRVSYVQEQQLLGDQIIRLGTIDYMHGEIPQFRIAFDKAQINDEIRSNPIIYVFDGNWFAEIRRQAKQFRKWQLSPPGQQVNVLEIGRSPFVMPIGQKARRVLNLFHVTLIQDDPQTQSEETQGLIHLRLIPRVDAETQAKAVDYQVVDIWYDPEHWLPKKVVALDDSQNLKTVRLLDITVDSLDPEEAPALFDTRTPPKGEGWMVDVKPYQQLRKPERSSPDTQHEDDSPAQESASDKPGQASEHDATSDVE